MLESTGGYSRRTTEALKHAKSEDLNHNLVAALVHHIHTHEDEEGAILVFLPGWEDINKVNTLLTQSRFQLFYAKIFPLHSLMPTATQREIFLRPNPGTRKVILSTNIVMMEFDNYLHIFAASASF